MRDLVLRRDVAAKRVRADLTGADRDDAHERLWREATVRTELTSVGILPLLDLVELDAATHLLGPWLPRSLADLLHPHGVSAATRVLSTVEQLATTVAALHGRGWWHGDLSPANVLLDHSGRPVLGDLGTLTPLGERPAADRPLTLTPAVTAPEVWRNDPTDPRGDVYALGVLAFWLLTGRFPFVADDPDRVRDLHQFADRPCASDVAPGVGPATDAVLMESLAPDPAERISDCNEFAQRLRAAFEADAIEPRTPASPTRVITGLSERLAAFAERLDDSERSTLDAALGRAASQIAIDRARFATTALPTFGVPALLRALEDTGVLAALATAPASLTTLSTRCDVAADRLEPVLRCLVAAHWIDRIDDRFHLSPMLHSAAGPLADTLPVRQAEALWRGATRWLLTGRPAVAMMDPDGAAYAAAADQLADQSRHAADELAARLTADRWLGPGTTIIDIGAGAGTWSLPMVCRQPGARLTVIDRPAVTARCLHRAERLGVAGRVEPGAADWRDLPDLLRTYDLAVLGNICHLFGPANAERLVATAAGVTTGTGALVVIDTMPTGDLDLAATLAAVHLGLRTGAGTIHAHDQYEAWLAAAGRHRITTIEFTTPGTSLTALIAAS